MKQLLFSVMMFAVLAVVPASAQHAGKHSQHHDTINYGQTTALPASSPDGSVSSQSPNENLPSATAASDSIVDEMIRMMLNASNPSSNDTATGSQPDDHTTRSDASVEDSGSPASPVPHVAAFGEAIEKMYKSMTEGVRAKNPDVAFVRGMIPHHQAVIDMALVVLQHGKDQQMRKLALEVIRQKSREIAEMNEWLQQQSH